MRATCNDASIAGGGCEILVVMNGIGITRSLGVCRNQRRSERDLSVETLSRISLHNLPPFSTKRVIASRGGKLVPKAFESKLFATEDSKACLAMNTG